VTIDLTDTNTGAIHDALTQARRRMGGPASGMVLTLIIVTNEEDQYDAVRAAAQAGREHPSRILAVIPRKPRADSRLDAEIRVGETGPGETILLRLYGPLAQHADSVVAPLLVPDVPVVTWWPDEVRASPVTAALGAVAQRRVTDAASNDSPRDMLLRLAELYQPGDTDLSWTRATPWRSLLASTLDQPYPSLLGGTVAAEAGNPTADLIAAWLRLRLGVYVTCEESPGPGITSVSFQTRDGDIVISRPDGRTATLSWPGRPDRRVALHRRDVPDLIAEELRRLEPDELYGETLAEFATGGAEYSRGDEEVLSS
jgi:glucose-6-phosphate dehydrogenase assembly protein OpcA